jgi:hypothetical protein
VSRYRDSDDYEGEPEQILAYGRWQHNARAALKGKRGRAALAELREALMALPAHRLIEGAVCTVDADRRSETHLNEATREWEQADPRWRPSSPLDWADQVEEFDAIAARNGEGVCGVGALIWWQMVKAGADPAEAFDSLPDIADEGGDGLNETAELAKMQAGLTYTLAWELAYRNDETFGRMTPGERWTAFVAWIDQELAEVAA